MIPSRILLVRLSAFGDILHGFPVASALRESNPGAVIHWLVEARYGQAAELCSSVDRIIQIDLTQIRGAGGWPNTIRNLRRSRYDVAIDLQGLIKSALLARLSGASEVLGFARGETRETPSSWFYSCRFDPKPYVHVIEKNLNLIRAMGVMNAKVGFPIRIPVTHSGARQPSNLAIIHPGSSATNKIWPTEYFGILAKRIHGDFGLEPLLVVGPGEEDLSRTILRIAGKSIRVFPPTSLASLAQLTAGARIFIGCDSGPTHLAAAIGIPVMAIHGPTDPARNGPWGQVDSVVSRFHECECRFKRTCRRSEPCITSISVGEVLDVIRRKLG